jgi:hypothetical protein
MVVQFEAASGDFKKTKDDVASKKSNIRQNPPSSSQAGGGTEGGGSSASGSANANPAVPRPSSADTSSFDVKAQPGPPLQRASVPKTKSGSPEKKTPPVPALSMGQPSPRPTDDASTDLRRRSVSMPHPGSSPRPKGSVSALQAATSSSAAPSTAPPATYLDPGQATLPPLPVRGTKSKAFATRFLQRLGARKERYQGQELPHLQPARDEDDMVGAAKQKRSLASKLLSRKATRNSSSSFTSSRGDHLGFAGHEASGMQNFNASVDENWSAPHSNSEAGDVLDAGEYGLEVVPEMEYPGPDRMDPLENTEGDGSLASSDGDDHRDVYNQTGAAHPRGNEMDAEPSPSPLTREALQRAASITATTVGGDAAEADGSAAGAHSMLGASSSGRGSWLRPGGVHSGGVDAFSVLEDDAASSVVELAETDENAGPAEGNSARGVYCYGRLSGFELVGERGTKVPNLTIGRADVRATVFVRFVFEYSKSEGWRPGQQPGDRPMFHVEDLAYSISGNNVPMPSTLIKHILRVAIPGLIQRRLLALLPKEFGEYLISVDKGFELSADVGVVGPALDVLDADIGFEVRGPARSAKDARRQAAHYAAAKEARKLLGLSLPQAQVLAELFNGAASLLSPARSASIAGLISFVASYERFPQTFQSLCRVIDTAYHVLAQAQGRTDVADFSFIQFLAGPVARMRRKPARTRVVVRSVDVGIDVDAVVTAIHDFTQRTIEELIVKGPLTDPGATLDTMRASVAAELELLHAWHAFALRELQHFKSKFRGAAGTVLAAADHRGFSAGIENCYYEGPLRLRMPVCVNRDADGAVSFELPLPSPEGKLGVFMDTFKSLMVPSHLRPPAAAVNWVKLTGDSDVDAQLQERLKSALGLIEDVLHELQTKIRENGLERDDEDPSKALSQPRTSVGDKLGRLIVNRLKLRVRLDERRIGEILSGIDGASMGGVDAFTATAGRIIGHLGDVMALGFCPAGGGDPVVPGATAAGGLPAPDSYLLHVESSDISRLRAELQSLGFRSAITPGGAVRLVHAVARAAQIGFLGRSPDELEAWREQMKGWYGLMIREALGMSACIDTKGEVEGNSFVVTLSGRADDSALRATSPMVVTNEVDLVALGKAMRGDPPEPPKPIPA